MLLENFIRETDDTFVKKQIKFENYLPEANSQKNSTKKIILSLSCLSADASRPVVVSQDGGVLNFYTADKRG